MSFSVNQAIETYINARDLSIRIYPFADKFGVIISRGRGEGEVTICGIPPYLSREDALAKTRHLFEIASQIGSHEIGDKPSTLGPELIEEILKRLRGSGVANTHELEFART